MSKINMGLKIWATIAGLALATGCVASQPDADTNIGGESHFLAGCTDSCDGDLECVSGVCTLPCMATSECTQFGSDALCLGDERQICDLECEKDAQCSDLGSDGFCAGGVCRHAAPQCSSDDEQHAVGESWTCPDGCNTCSCHEDGLRTTAVACGPIPMPTACDAEGVSHAIGESWSCGEDCRMCTCSPNGMVLSSSAPCPPPVECLEGGKAHELGESWTCSDGCNTCDCTPDGVVTTDLACPQAVETCDGVHAPGENFACDCNTCTCEADGSITSTLVDCNPDAGM